MSKVFFVVFMVMAALSLILCVGAGSEDGTDICKLEDHCDNRKNDFQWRYEHYQLSQEDQRAAQVLAKLVYGEARGCSKAEQAAVVWCVLNRVDSPYYGNDIISVATAKNQFVGYRPSNPTAYHIDIVWDVLIRWRLEQEGFEDVGRTIPKEYLYFNGDGRHNHFRTHYQGGTIWNWSLPDPYSWEVSA